ncbi:hypothetical protein BC793_12244 [Actinoplanes xinjiangensis]|uniref:Uncharacterized protein n=3 Tax=Actinoplanes xinjiangensis TaxID=512350 RepID=A0A316F432_9ACTN|nr:hypothetical protein BC793_12244 [Actinoplanes xinjiangensis]GIF42664.1 hypothetical protein Axi01nite_69750 [Actinoplanes xinjiangensis]
MNAPFTTVPTMSLKRGKIPFGMPYRVKTPASGQACDADERHPEARWLTVGAARDLGPTRTHILAAAAALSRKEP